MAIADRHGLPVAVCTESASPAEVKLVTRTIEERFIADPPARLIGDKAYDSDPLRWRLLERGILLISPHRAGRQKPSLNDGRELRRYRKRYKVERTFAWLGNYRRLLVRYDHDIKMYEAFFHVACLLITLRHL